MATYLLLRNNKEQGPFSFDQLVSLGFKPYDLVWVEGKSAAWRYPGEIKELEPYAPVVEDQPFDRFYKKETTEKVKVTAGSAITETIKASSTKADEETHAVVKEPVFTEQHIFVALPAQKTQTIPEVPEKKHQVAGPVTEPVKTYLKPVPEPVAEEEAVLETKYSQSLDDIKDLYKQTLLNRKKKIEQLKFLREWGPKAAVVLVILLAGIFIGKQIAGGTRQPEEVITNKTVIPSPPLSNENEAAEQDLPPEADSILAAEKNNSEPRPFNMDVLPGANNSGASVTGTAAPPKIRERAVIPAETKPIVPMHETKNSVSAPERKQPAFTREDILKKIKVNANDYKQGAFGGVKNLQLTVSNQSGYVLDNVAVEVQYLKPSEEVLKTEMVYFSGIAPGGTLTVKVPDSSRGVKLVYRIAHVASRALDADLAATGF